MKYKYVLSIYTWQMFRWSQLSLTIDVNTSTLTTQNGNAYCKYTTLDTLGEASSNIRRVGWSKAHPMTKRSPLFRQIQLLVPLYLNKPVQHDAKPFLCTFDLTRRSTPSKLHQFDLRAYTPQQYSLNTALVR